MKAKTNSKTNISIAPFDFSGIDRIELTSRNVEVELPKGEICVNNSAVEGNARYIGLAYYDNDNNRNYIEPFWSASLQDGKLVAFTFNDLDNMIVINNISKICAYESLALGSQFINCYKVGD